MCITSGVIEVHRYQFIVWLSYKYTSSTIQCLCAAFDQVLLHSCTTSPTCPGLSSRIFFQALHAFPIGQARSQQPSCLPALLPVRLIVLEWIPACPLIRTRLPADPAITARKQNAPRRHRSQETRAERA